MVRKIDAFRLPGYDFVDPGLLAQTLTHRSAASLHKERGGVTLAQSSGLMTLSVGLIQRLRACVVRQAPGSGGSGPCPRGDPGLSKGGGATATASRERSTRG